MSNIIWITWRGKSQTMSEWAKELGFTKQLIHYRLKQGWDLEEALTVLPNGKSRSGARRGPKVESLIVDGEAIEPRAFAKLVGVSACTVRNRIKAGETAQEIWDKWKAFRDV